MKPLVFHLPSDEAFAEGLVRALRAERAALQLHRFPDGESLVRLDADVTGRTIVIVASLAQPDAKALPLLFAADAYDALLAAGPARVLTCDTVPHASNGISVVAPLAAAVQDLIEASAT